ncbi:hypothetical protein [Paenibacillus abyssi]|uniref:Uncharacterized protein n=1 Tax=Paenibacillus abyssi TaxID=1340531 RepID=A0A917FLN4_9BACL|nr:hypothetical protein [Paenibacillus abyssi]GGF87904.1 hypothetical protein GCM10010916_01540 [Paenibacillus abyssi]
MAQEIKRALPRKRNRVQIVKVTVKHPDGTTEEVDAKECTKCGVVKALLEFNTNSNRCSECAKESARGNYKQRKVMWEVIEGGKVQEM